MPRPTEDDDMSDDGAQGGEQHLLSVVEEARGRLARIAGREHLQRKGWWVLGAGAAAAALRPLVWRLSEDAPLWWGIARAAGLFAAGSAMAAGALILIGRRRGPSVIGAARALDEALGGAEVIASGFAFQRDARTEPVVMLARRRAAETAKTARVKEHFPLPRLRLSSRAVGALALVLIAALGVGGYERGLVTALLAPPTAIENEAAAELEEAAAEMAAQPPKEVKAPAPEHEAPKREKSDEKLSSAGNALADKAKDAARAARRGDRRGALEKLEALRAEGKQRSARAGDLGKTLRKVAEALAPPSDEKRGRDGASAAAATPSQDAAESMRLLAQKMKSPEGGAAGGGGESKERVLERLERAAEEARRGAAEGKGQDASETARALSRAAESLKRGDREAASQALAQAAERAAAMEQARAAAMAEAMAIVDMLEKSGALERAIQMAMLGQDGENGGEKGEGMAMLGDGKDGEGKDGSGQGKGGKGGSGKGGKDGNGSGGEGGKQGGGGASALRKAIMARLMAMGVAGAPQEGGDASNGSGPHMPDRHRSKRAALTVQGSVRAPSQVGEGPRAIQAINGLGRGTEPPAAYREVFPTYDAAAEEGLADERIPAQRRAAVRRYFQSIRPEQHE
ncbi:TolA protein [Minicystis rosea]|nr:TolA protein [Minicystis rosea]